MSDARTSGNTDAVDRLLAGAARAIETVRYCWLATPKPDGGTTVRPMGRLPRDAGEEAWKMRFVTDGRSRKAAALRRDSRVSLVFQDDPAEAYVALIGRAVLREEAAEVRRRWKKAYDVYFPTEADRASAAFIEVEAERLELWIRGVTPEPYGLTATVLERGADHRWRIISN